MNLQIAKSNNEDVFLLSDMANRHGLIAGATGTGKTVSLQRMAEMFSSIGVPVFMADVKGDLTGVAMEAKPSEKLSARLAKIGASDWAPRKNPVQLWDMLGDKGHPIRATISDMGPLLLARLLNLSDVQEGVLQIVFKIADDNELLLLDLKDLQAMLKYIADNSKDFQTTYGNITDASIGAIQRGLLTLEQQGADKFFGEPMLDIHDLIATDEAGNGIINILAADKLYNMPKLYAMSLLWLLSELFENLPEAGDLDKPKLVFFFDEAHLLFNDMPDALLESIERVVRLIRSKGVGIYFVTQNPADVPDTVLGQLGNRLQHALRAFTPKDLKGVKAAAQSMRANPEFNTEKAIQELGIGEALISFLNEDGSPTVVQKSSVIAPGSRLGPITEAERKDLLKGSAVYGKYEKTIDRESAFEHLQEAMKDAEKEEIKMEGRGSDIAGGLLGGLKKLLTSSTSKSMLNSAKRTLKNEVTRKISRGILGSMRGKFPF